MAFEQRHTDLLNRYASKFGLPALDGDSARTWTFNLGSQFAFTFPTEGWGTKSAGGGRPQSTDVICTHTPFIGYDVIGGQGTPSQVLIPNPGPIDLTGQIFIGTPPKDFLGAVTPPIPVPVPPARPYDEAKSIQFGKGCNDVYKESGAPFDPGMVSVHSSRAAFDYYTGKLTWDESYKGHINDFRKEYGLAPLP